MNPTFLNPPLLFRNQAANIVDVALSRIVSLPAFTEARRAFIYDRIPRIKVKAAGFHQFIHELSMPEDLAMRMEGMANSKEMGLAMFATSQLPFFEEGGPSQARLLGHESVHVAQRAQNDPLHMHLPYFERPEEEQAYTIQDDVARFLERVRQVDSSIFDEDHPAVRTAKLNLATTKIRNEVASQIKLLQELPESERRDHSIFNKQEELAVLNKQVEALDRKIKGLMEPTRTDPEGEQ